ncbi:MAG: hypothetical protein M3Q07_22485 [Pseudobdellovibrionaceae bacterium]|nr:hypothetical protein [Pseudobdellovibrionaceae bacterium]
MKIIFRIILATSCSASVMFAHGNEGARSGVGPNQGVLEADEHDGFVLRPSAEQNFAVQKFPLKTGTPWTIPAKALIYSGLEIQVFRQREGHWKTADVDVIRKAGTMVEVRSKDLIAGDQIAVEGTGFLKIIEQSVFGPAAAGHDH